MHKLTSKRQVTVPQKVCDALGLAPGDYVEFFERDGVGHLVKMQNGNLAGAFSGFKKKISTLESEEIKSALKQRAAKKFRRNDDSR